MTSIIPPDLDERAALAAELRQAAAALRDEAARLDKHAAEMRRLADQCAAHADAMDGTR